VISGSNIRYIIARLMNMAVRPAALSASAYFFGKAQAEDLSLIISAVAIAMMMMSIDPYRAYYKRLFNHQPSGTEFAVYIITIVTWGGVVAAVTAAMLALRGVPTSICLLAPVAFAGDKVADEVLRFRLFEKDVGRWSNLVIGRSVVQLGGLAVCILLPGRTDMFALYLGLYCASWIPTYWLPLMRVVRLVGGHPTAFARPKLWRRARGRFLASAGLMAASLMSSVPTYFDKLVAVSVNKASVPPFLIAAMCFSIIGNFVDFFYVSRIRVDLLRNDRPVFAFLSNRALWASVLSGLVAGSAIMAGEQLLLGRIYAFDLPVLCIITIINITLAITAIPQQIVYWRDGPRGIFKAEIPFLALLATGFGVFHGQYWNLAGVLAIIAVGLLARLIFYIGQSQAGEAAAASRA